MTSDGNTYLEEIPETLVDYAKSYYRQSHRHYHDWRHIEQMLGMARSRGLQLTTSQVLAVLYHDAAYVLGQGNGLNERMSAGLLLLDVSMAYATSESYSEALADARDACPIILATATHDVDVKKDKGAALVIDLDLSGLADDYEVFQERQLDLYNEYFPLLNEWSRVDRGVEADFGMFVQKQGEFLRKFVERPRVFLTDELAYLEGKARDNIKRLYNVG